MKIYIQLPTREVIVIEGDLNDSILKIKEEIAKQKNIPVNEQTIYSHGVSFDNTIPLREYHIEPYETLHLSMVPAQKENFSPSQTITQQEAADDPQLLELQTSLNEILEKIKKVSKRYGANCINIDPANQEIFENIFEGTKRKTYRSTMY